MWSMVHLTELREVPIEKLDDWALDLWFEFSIEYDINSMRMARQEERIKIQKQAKPDKKVLDALGY